MKLSQEINDDFINWKRRKNNWKKRTNWELEDKGSKQQNEMRNQMRLLKWNIQINRKWNEERMMNLREKNKKKMK